MDVSRLIDWAQRAYPYDGNAPVPNGYFEERGPAQAAAQLAKAYEYHQSGRLNEKGIQHFAYGLTTLASMLTERDESDAAAATFQAALQAFATLPPGSRVDKAMEHCRRCLQRLSVPESTELPTLLNAPFVNLAELLEVPAPAVSPAATAEAGAGPAHLGGFLAFKEGLNTYFEQLTGHSHLARRSFGKTWSQDLEAAHSQLPDRLSSEHSELVSYARQLRQSGGTKADERRIAFLQAALVNYCLWRRPDDGLRSNEPQLRVDLIRYAGAVLGEGLRKSSRDLILGSVEAQVAVAHETPPMLLRTHSLLDALLGSVGSYLLVAGPNPAQAHEIEYDERISNHLGGPGDKKDQGLFGRGRSMRVSRPLWPVHLLKQWQSGRDMKSASFALASVAGWDRARARWLLEQLFAATSDAADDLTAWQDAVDTLLTAVSKVEVVYNPRAPMDSDFTQSSVITSDRTGRLWVPDPVLKAAVAQGLDAGDAAKVRGENFVGSRMPTYLLTNKYGPVSILKIDYAERVVREEENFHRYAEKRLHQKYRPSRCEAHDMEMYLGEEGKPLRAIVTSYAFEESEEALTLGAWFKTATVREAADAIERLLLTTMRSWITDIRRDRVDLRAEYPVFRPTAAPDKQSPDSTARRELEALTDSVTEELLGLPLPSKDKRSAESLLGKTLGLQEAAAHLGGLELINPLWFAASIAELDATKPSSLDGLVDPKAIDLRDYEALLVLAHGDLHMDNVLCASNGLTQSHAILIDFESTHYGHVCKDFARLEACVLTHVFTWSSSVAGQIAEIVATNIDLAPPFDGDQLDLFLGLSDEARLVLCTVRRIREAAFGCGQGNWPIPIHEYQLALAGSLIPMIRSSGMTLKQRQFALTLSTVVCSALLASWQEEAGTSSPAPPKRAQRRATHRDRGAEAVEGEPVRVLDLNT
ncbi:aminoglycoside phosphotransferase family protein (plasmid) [Streptomyces sp. NBC_00257]|uniref:phosphotransferase n=1 Tax=unclassified Streptomyces TaxID=2593676 RepID=UPI00225241BB|nr:MULTISPECIES: phosphotransferase [unclassified Streptomyces]MCX5434698.1 aminoglycoside phosphotransferase family protein [Streptomyces sp. NBC_00062]